MTTITTADNTTVTSTYSHQGKSVTVAELQELRDRFTELAAGAIGIRATLLYRLAIDAECLALHIGHGEHRAQMWVQVKVKGKIPAPKKAKKRARRK